MSNTHLLQFYQSRVSVALTSRKGCNSGLGEGRGGESLSTGDDTQHTRDSVCGCGVAPLL